MASGIFRPQLDDATIGILIASLISGVSGALLLSGGTTNSPRNGEWWRYQLVQYRFTLSHVAVKTGKWLASWVREYMATPHRPEKPPDRPSNQPPPTERDGDQAPDTPPTEPEPIPVEEPPNAPGKRGPYVVHSNLSSGAISGVGDPHEVRIVGHRSVIPVRQGTR